MSARLISRYADDPKVVTVLVVVLVSAALWVATWQTMSGMSMGDMKMGGAEMGGAETGGAEMGGSKMGGAKMGSMGMAEKPTAMADGMAMDASDWSARTIVTTIATWILMMAAMMLPAMAPVCAIYAGLAAKEDRGARLALRITLFAMGYFLLWTLFSVGAGLGQLALRDSAWFAMGGTLALPFAAGVLLIIAGTYQFTTVKQFCLRHCRHPLTYLMSHWREDLEGAFPVGARHGVYCLGCCIALMGLMFVFGAMNVIWMALIAVYFLAEKTLPASEIWGRVAGALMIVAGAVMVTRNLV